MSLHYLLDGYNISNQLPDVAHESLEEQRQRLVSLIERYRPEGSSRNRVTLVFDGQAGMYGRPNAGSVDVVFSYDESADDWIKKAVRRSTSSKSIIVVTDDRDIQYAVKADGARILTVRAFLKRLSESRASKSSSHLQGKHIPQTLEHQITTELEQLWLSKEKERKRSKEQDADG